jgi:hypothetical protein
MTRWVVRWKPATGPVSKGPPIGSFDNRWDAEIFATKQAHAAADAMEFGTGTAGVATPDGRLFRGDLDDALLGRYVIRKIDPDSREKRHGH